jgi:hypothetical protein
VGRTNPTYRDAVTALRERWGDFERALRRRDKPAFERLFEHARAHADAGGYLNHEEPLFPILLSVDLEQEKRLADLEDQLGDLEERLAAAEERLEDGESESESASVSTAATETGATDAERR